MRVDKTSVLKKVRKCKDYLNAFFVPLLIQFFKRRFDLNLNDNYFLKIVSFKCIVIFSGESTRKLPLEWERIRCFDKEVAVMFMQQVKNQSEAKVINVSTKEKAKERPIALNTVELMRVASSGLGMGPHHAMQIAEKLYTQGNIIIIQCTLQSENS